MATWNISCNYKAITAGYIVSFLESSSALYFPSMLISLGIHHSGTSPTKLGYILTRGRVLVVLAPAASPRTKSFRSPPLHEEYKLRKGGSLGI